METYIVLSRDSDYDAKKAINLVWWCDDAEIRLDFV